jgi:hypothetical protein
MAKRSRFEYVFVVVLYDGDVKLTRMALHNYKEIASNSKANVK